MLDKHPASPPTRGVDRSIAAVACRQHGLVTARQLAGTGLSRQAIHQRVRAGRLHRVQRGVYAVGHTVLSVQARRLAAVLAVGDDAVASHVTAAAIWDIRRTSTATLHVTAPGDARDRRGIRVHRAQLHDDDRAVRDRIPVTSLARTLVDLGDVVPAAQVRNAFVRAEQLRLVDVVAIEAALARASPRRRGRRALREVLRVHDPRWERTRSDLELAFLDLALVHGLPEAEVNAWIEDRFLVDALWRDERLIVEADGAQTHDTPTGRRDDARRDRILVARGYRVLRAPYAEIVHRPAGLAARVRVALDPPR